MMKVRVLNGNIIKIIAAITMLIDHMGYFLFPQYDIFRMIGRISMPLFAFLIAEGCRYTRSRFRHVSFIAALSIVYALAFNFAYGYIYWSIFSTFTFSILIIYALQNFKKSIFKNEGAVSIAINGALLCSLIAFVYVLNLNTHFGKYEFLIDYGFWGCMLPVFASLTDLRGSGLKDACGICDNYYLRLLFFAFGITFMCLHSEFSFAWYAYLALIPLVLYNGKKGKLNLKYLFYVFYPVHMATLYLIYMFISGEIWNFFRFL